VDEIVCSCVVDVWYQNRRILRNGGLWIFVHWNLKIKAEIGKLEPQRRLKELSHVATYKIIFKLRKPENNSLLRKKNIKETVINHNGVRMVRD